MPLFITLSQLRKRFADQLVLRGISLEIEQGEILVLLGPSGSGKTTLLRLIAGFERPDDGSILVAEEDVAHLPPERRNFGMVFQHFALFPHLSVAGNIAFGLETQGLSRDAIRERVATVLELVGLGGFEGRRVQELSGGQQQRVALARALAPDPRLLLLDEPLSNLDPDLRERTRRQIRQAIKQVGITAIWVTHEQEEAFDVGDRVALLHDGDLEQLGRPEELYLEPGTRFVAGFVGRASVLRGILGDDGRVRIGDERYRGYGVSWPVVAPGDLDPGEEVEVVFRPESLCLVASEHPQALTGNIVERHYTGEATFYRVELDWSGELLVRAEGGGSRREGRVAVTVNAAGSPPRAFRAVAEDGE